MPITRHDQQALDQIYTDYSDRYKGRKEDYFALLYLKSKFQRNPEEIANWVSFGGNDFGIDAFYIDRNAKSLYLYQFKWSENHNLFKDSLERIARDGLAQIFAAASVEPNQNEVLNTLRAELSEVKSGIDHVFVHFVFKGHLDAVDKSEGLAQRRETVENKSHLVHHFFGRDDVELAVEFISDRRTPPPARPSESHSISFTKTDSIRSDDGKREMYVGFVPLMDLYRIFRSMGQRFLDRNIRSGLSADNPPNRKIREALSDIVLKQKYSPDVFSFNHNGVTLAAERLQFEDGRSMIHVPRLLNGAQTITSVSRFLQDNSDHPTIKNGAPALESIRLLAKIVIDDPSSDFVAQVTICNNRQNPVEPWHLRANDKIQCDLHDRLKESVGVFYSRQENAYRNYSADDLEELGYDSAVQRDMKIRPLAQTFLASQGEIARMSQLPEVFENQRQYEDTFRPSYVESDARKIVLAYKVGLLLKDALRQIEEHANQKIRVAVPRARNLIWAMLIQGLLNDAKLPELLDEYGTSLRKENAIRELLKKLASQRVLPILRDVLAKPEHADRMAQEKYDFLRTKELFTQCKDAAADRFQWTKRSL
ncbi:MAG: AIPR family protein [Planctomycetota bacterium]|nr:AIPR family protein [Planctomycetota bacterium]